MKKLILSILCSLLLCGQVWGATYAIGSDGDYVSWAAMEADGKPSANDTVQYKKGETFRESFTVDDSSLAIESYGAGARPKLSGATTLGAWTDTTANDEHYIAVPVDIDGTNKIRFLLKDGVPVDRLDDDSQHDGAGANELGAGQWCLDTGNTRIYYVLDGVEADMTGSTWEAGYGLIMDLNGADSLTIDGLEFYGGSRQIYTDDENKVETILITDCVFTAAGLVAIWPQNADGFDIGDQTTLATSTSWSNKFQYCRMDILTGGGGGPE